MAKAMGRLRARIVSGIAVLIPLFITIWVLRALFGFTVGIVLPILTPAVDHWPPLARVALAVTLLLLLVYGLGELAAHVVGRRVIALGDEVLLRVPVVRVIYRASRQVVSSFQRQDRSAFKSVVLIEFPRPGTRAVAFVTSVFSRPDGSLWKTVFVPTTPNPTTGFLQILPASEVTSTDFTVEEAFQMVMSLGVLSPDRIGSMMDPDSRERFVEESPGQKR
jgi:uncharacterized membrane protein